MSGPLLIRGGRVIDPSQSMDSIRDVLVVEGVIAEVRKGIDAPEGAREIDAEGLVVTPGLIDVHVHLREPGGEHKETIATGARAAAAGGFTAVCAMPNTDPVVDDPAGVGFVLAQGVAAGAARVYPVGAISVGQEGRRLAAIGEMFAAGAVGITDDGNPVMDSGLMRKALEYAQAFDIPVADHPEDLGLSSVGVMNEGLVATRLGLHGKPNASEDVHIVRDLLLADLTGGHIHLQHVSTAYGVEAIGLAKARGVRVTAEATPHHLIFTDERVEGFDTDAKMNPPLRSARDREAVREGLADGTLDVFATDHAPHHYDEKEQAFADAPNGIIGLETALGLGLTHVVGEGLTDLPTLIHRMSVGPAEAFGLPGGTLAPGSPGDVTIVDLEEAWTVDRDVFLSKSHNTPFHGWELKGRALYTIVGGCGRLAGGYLAHRADPAGQITFHPSHSIRVEEATCGRPVEKYLYLSVLDLSRFPIGSVFYALHGSPESGAHCPVAPVGVTAQADALLRTLDIRQLCSSILWILDYHHGNVQRKV